MDHNLLAKRSVAPRDRRMAHDHMVGGRMAWTGAGMVDHRAAAVGGKGMKWVTNGGVAAHGKRMEAVVRDHAPMNDHMAVYRRLFVTGRVWCFRNGGARDQNR